MVSLSDTDLSAVMDAARPIPPQSRDRFLREVAAELAKHSELGPGLVGRVARDVDHEQYRSGGFRRERRAAGVAGADGGMRIKLTGLSPS